MKRKRPKRASAGSAAASQPAGSGAGSAVRGGGRGAKKGGTASKRLRAEELEAPEGADSEAEDEEVKGSDDKEEDGDGSDLEVEFEFFDPAEEDYHSVGDLTKNGLWEFVELNFAEMSDSIVGQGNIGTLIKSESQAGGASGPREDTVCALLTVLNLRQFSNLSWPGTVRVALLKKAEQHADSEAVEKLRDYLQPKAGSETGLLLSERFVNLPPQLVPPLHKALLEDIKWSCSTPECPPEERPFYEFTHFVGLARCFQAKPDADASGPRSKRKKGAAPPSGGAAANAGNGGLVFAKAEDEFYFKRAAVSFTFPLSDAASSKQRAGGVATGAKEIGGRGPELRAVFVLTRKAFEQAVTEIGKSDAFVP